MVLSKSTKEGIRLENFNAFHCEVKSQAERHVSECSGQHSMLALKQKICGRVEKW